MPLQSFFCVVSLTLAVASAREDCVATAAKTCAENGDRVAASATNSIIQGRVDVLAGVELKVHPDSDVAKKGRGEWIILPDGGCRQGDLEALAANMPNNTRALIHGHPDSGGLCFFVMEGTQEGVWQKLMMHRWNGTPKVETDTAVHFDAHNDQESWKDPADLSWGLDRIDTKIETGLDGSFKPMGNTGGSGVDVYIMDSGIRTSHTEFGGRAVPKLETFGGEVKVCASNVQDCAVDKHGHGTFVAGIVGGQTVGVAPQATLHAVKVIDGETGTAKSLHVAFDWLLSQNLPVASTVFTVSLSLAASTGCMYSAFKETCSRGITAVAAAGNHGLVRSTGWVSGSTGVIVVAATTIEDKEWLKNAKYKNMFAPGQAVKSAWIYNDLWFRKQSGTSAAAPYVAGAAARLLSEAKSMGKTFVNGGVKETLLRESTNINPCKACSKRPFLYIGDDPGRDWMSKAEAGRPEELSGTAGLPYDSASDMESTMVLR